MGFGGFRKRHQSVPCEPAAEGVALEGHAQQGEGTQVMVDGGGYLEIGSAEGKKEPAEGPGVALLIQLSGYRWVVG